MYDYGTWTAAGGFASAGPTTGEVVAGSGGTVTIDVPAATGAVPGAVLTQLFVLTYDGVDSPTQPHWVDRAPGGVTPVGSEFGADYVVGPCGAPPPGGGGGGGAVTAVTLSAAAKRTGAGPVTVSGGVAPARGGVPVDLSINDSKQHGAGSSLTNADGSFSVSLRLSETTRLRATAGGLSSRDAHRQDAVEDADRDPAHARRRRARPRHASTRRFPAACCCSAEAGRRSGRANEREQTAASASA